MPGFISYLSGLGKPEDRYGAHLHHTRLKFISSLQNIAAATFVDPVPFRFRDIKPYVRSQVGHGLAAFHPPADGIRIRHVPFEKCDSWKFNPLPVGIFPDKNPHGVAPRA
jgi:hypothetical protein